MEEKKMNLKEAFRFQNKLNELITKSEDILRNEGNIMTVTNTVLKSKVDKEAENEVTREPYRFSLFDLDGKVTRLADFLMYLFDERRKLTGAIEKTKAALDIDIDAETALNVKRQEIMAVFSNMVSIRGSEVVIPKGGIGYRFNAEGNQTPYKCDVKIVKTINYDRNKVKTYLKKLGRENDETSSKIDYALVSSSVEYISPFDVNDGFVEIFEEFAS